MSDRTRLLAWTALTVLVAAGAAMVGGAMVRRDDDAERVALQERLAALEQEVDALAEAHSHAGGTVAAPVAGAAMPHADADAGVAIADAHGPHPERDPQRDPESIRADLEASYARERRDAVWAAQAELALSKAAAADELVAANLVPTSIDAQCRARQCRIVARFPDAGAAEEWSYGYMTNTAGTLRVVRPFRRVLPDGSVELTLYGER